MEVVDKEAARRFCPQLDMVFVYSDGQAAFRATVYPTDYKPDKSATGNMSLARQMQLDKTDKE